MIFVTHMKKPSTYSVTGVCSAYRMANCSPYRTTHAAPKWLLLGMCPHGSCPHINICSDLENNISSLCITYLINSNRIFQVNYEASGWVVHQVTDLWAKTSPDRGQAVWALWPMGGAWTWTHFWEHYTYTMDKVSSWNIVYSLFLEEKELMFGCSSCQLSNCMAVGLACLI